MTQQEEWKSITQAAKELKMKPQQISRLVARKEIQTARSIYDGRVTLVNLVELRERYRSPIIRNER